MAQSNEVINIIVIVIFNCICRPELKVLAHVLHQGYSS